MNANETARLAAAIALLRPDWAADSLRTFIASKLGERPYRDAAVALTYIACEPESKTPARVLGPGPWWKVGADDWDPPRNRKCSRCSEFHLPTVACEPIVVRTGKHATHIAEAREILRDTKARLCAHRVVPWLCADCKPTARPTEDVPLPTTAQESHA